MQDIDEKGGKIPEGPVHDVARNTDLLRSGVSVLKALLVLLCYKRRTQQKVQQGSC
jgi:hypothetical protein